MRNIVKFALAGAMILGDYTEGMFVTTSSFQSGAPDTSNRLGIRGYPIQLLDGARFFDALMIAQKSVFEKPENISEYEEHLILLEEEVVHV